ncbi:MAG: cytidine deaminase [Bacteroidetes bacterium]|nr:cytidine deaminase [Bacteroidota bacterium]
MDHFMKILRHHVRDAEHRSYVPYSGKPRAAVILLSNGDWVCGVRIENACYPLVIPALTSALVSAASLGRRDVVAISVSDHFKDEDLTFIQQAVHQPLDQLQPDLLGLDHHAHHVGEPLSACQESSSVITSQTGIHLARRAIQYAHTPESDFPVGSIAVTDDHHYYQGVNIEYPDWTKILCAERAAIASAISHGDRHIKNIFVSAPKSLEITPCGACRQVIYELAPNATVWMDRGGEMIDHFHVKDLLPGGFTLKRTSGQNGSIIHSHPTCK